MYVYRKRFACFRYSREATNCWENELSERIIYAPRKERVPEDIDEYMDHLLSRECSFCSSPVSSLSCIHIHWFVLMEHSSLLKHWYPATTHHYNIKMLATRPERCIHISYCMLGCE
jgi:hypothetical protein